MGLKSGAWVRKGKGGLRRILVFMVLFMREGEGRGEELKGGGGSFVVVSFSGAGTTAST